MLTNGAVAQRPKDSHTTLRAARHIIIALLCSQCLAMAEQRAQWSVHPIVHAAAAHDMINLFTCLLRLAGGVQAWCEHVEL